MAKAFNFGDAFRGLTEHEPFPWQRRLFDEWLSRGKLPQAVDIPTGLGKTAVMAIWLLARAAGATLPRRLVYVVDRRAVVDQATDFAEQLRKKLQEDKGLEPVRKRLGLNGGPLAISTLRGRYVDNREWMADPSAPAIIVGTVDMVGSRLLFEGYGVSRRMRPYAAGLMGCDSLVLLDEAHLAHPFERLLRTIEREQCPPSANGPDGADPGMFAGPAASAVLPPPFHVLPLSATMSQNSSSESFGVDNEDMKNKTVHKRLEASKVLTIEELSKNQKLDEVLAERAADLMRNVTETAGKPARILVYCDTRKDAEKVAGRLRKPAKKDVQKEKQPEPVVILLVGGRRVHERKQAATELKDHGVIAGDSDCVAPVFVVATSAGEVGVDLDADHMVCDLVAWERMVQRLGRVNRRGAGQARVLVIDKKDKDAPDCHGETKALLKNLPRDETDGHRGHQASPAALMKLRSNPKFRERITTASTRTPLYPALTRALVDAWSMTSLDEHTGRPEVGPWLRGWVENDQPQTVVVWRQYLPLRFEDGNPKAQPQPGREVKAFFGAAPPHTEELLETETYRVVEWLKARAEKILERIRQEAETRDSSGDPGTGDSNPTIAPLRRDAPIAFLLDRASRPVRPGGTLTLSEIAEGKKKDLQKRLAGQQLVVDSRLGGLKEGLLDKNSNDPVSTIEDNWNELEHEDSRRLGPSICVQALTEQERDERLRERQAPEEDASRAVHLWREALAIPYRVSPEGSATAWLVVEKRRGGNNDEASKAIAYKAQRLDDHQSWAADEAGRIAKAVGLDERYRKMLMSAACHHDDGKKSPRWQRAFNAPRAGRPYAKTKGPCNRHALNGYRHELKSALDAETSGLEGIDRSEPRFELALHLIASHHGHARPTIDINGYDELPPSAVAARAHEIALRFARLQAQWGPWGLAWWEALLRAADQRASRALEKSGSGDGGGGTVAGIQRVEDSRRLGPSIRVQALTEQERDERLRERQAPEKEPG